MAHPESPSISVSRRGSSSAGSGSHTVVWVRGEHDVATKHALAAAIERAAQLEDADLLVDLSEVTFLDASTIGAIVESRNRLRSRSQLLEVRSPTPYVCRLLQLCGLDDLVRGSTTRTLAGR